MADKNACGAGVRALLRENALCLEASASLDGALWSLNRAAALDPGEFQRSAPTFAPHGWAPRARLPDQARYSQHIARDFPEVDVLLHTVHGVVTARAAAARPLWDAPRADDMSAMTIDLFLVGLDPTDMGALWMKLDEIENALRAPHVYLVEKLTPGVATFALWNTSDVLLYTVRVHLCVFPSVSAVLYGCDIPCEAVAYDGRRTVMTRLAVTAYAFRANIVMPTHSGPEFERRLLDYFGRGFALVFAHMRPGLFELLSPLELPHMCMLPEMVRGNTATGVIALPAAPPPALRRAELRSPGRCRCGGVRHLVANIIALGESELGGIGDVAGDAAAAGDAAVFTIVGCGMAAATAPPSHPPRIPFGEYAAGAVPTPVIAPDELRRGGDLVLRAAFKDSEEHIHDYIIAESLADRKAAADLVVQLLVDRAHLVRTHIGWAPAEIRWWYPYAKPRARMERPVQWYGGLKNAFLSGGGSCADADVDADSDEASCFDDDSGGGAGISAGISAGTGIRIGDMMTSRSSPKGTVMRDFGRDRDSALDFDRSLRELKRELDLSATAAIDDDDTFSLC